MIILISRLIQEFSHSIISVFKTKQLELKDKIMIILIMEGIVHLHTYLYSIC